MRTFRDSLKNYDQITIVGHENSDFDSVASGILLEGLLRALGVDATFKLLSEPDEYAAKYIQMCGYNIDKYISHISPDEFLFLVDCNTTELKNNIVGCIDHHPTEHRQNYAYYYNQPSSSAALSVLKHMESCDIIPTREEYYLSFVSVYMDTQSLKSSKFLPSDGIWLSEISRKFGFDSYLIEKWGYCYTDMSKDLDELCRNGLKKYSFAENTVYCSNIQCDDPDEELKSNICRRCKELISELGINMWVLIFTEPKKEHSEVWSFSPTGERREEYDRLISRAIDVIPKIEKEFLNI